MTDLYDALEICLNEIEGGAEIESVLLRYPNLADELRPILHASKEAKSLAAPEPSADGVRRSRAKVLQRAAELREQSGRPRFTINWSLPLRRLASTLAVLVLAFVSGTSLVGAASTSLPGDNLYPVKRSWERLQLVVTIDARTRETLEVDQENERIDELQKLFAGQRTAAVEFNGLVTRQDEAGWLIAGIRVVIQPDTNLPDGQVLLNSPVRVEGLTQKDGSVFATSIELLSPDASLPEVEDRSGADSNPSNENESGPGLGKETPNAAPSQTPEPAEVKFDGTLNVRDGDFWTINGIPSNVSGAEVEGTPVLGAAVTVEGYFNPDGVFIVTKIKFEDKLPGSDSGSGSNSNSNGNGNSNSNDNDNTNSNDNDNGSGGGNNNGSGGGDD
jgi:hypothetical protein